MIVLDNLDKLWRSALFACPVPGTLDGLITRCILCQHGEVAIEEMRGA